MKPSLVLPVLLSASIVLSACSGGTEGALTRARDYMQSENYNAAIIELKDLLRTDTTSAEARWLLASAYLKSGDLMSAEKELRVAQRLGWTDDDVIPALAEALLGLGEFVKIRELSNDGLSPTAMAELMAVRALAEVAQGETGAAELLMRRALQLAPDSRQVKMAEARLQLAKGDTDGALAMLDEILATDPRDKEAWLVKANILTAEHVYDEAIVAYGEVIAIDEESYAAYVQRAMIFLQTGAIEEAQADADRLAKLAPKAPGTNYINGVLLYRNGDYDAALKALTIAEPAFRAFPLVLFYLGSVQFMVGSYDQAEVTADRFLSMAPNHAAGRKLLATIALRDGDSSRVLRLLSPVLENEPDDVSALNLMANALLSAGRSDEAVAMLQRVAELRPDSAEARVRLGAGLMLGGEKASATEQIETALAMNPEFQQGDILLILNHLRERDTEAALKAAEDYVGRNPQSVAAHNLLGRVHATTGDVDSARAALRNSLKIDEADPGAHALLASLDLASGDIEAARKHYETVLATYPEDLPTLMLLADLQFDQQQAKRGSKTLDEAMLAHPQSLAPRLRMAQYRMASGEPQLVEPLFSGLEPILRDAPEALRVRSAAFMQAGQYEQAQELLAILQQSGQADAATYHMMARVAARGGDNASARQLLEQALALQPDHLPSLLASARMAMTDGDEETYQARIATLEQVSPELIDLLLIKAVAAYRAGDTASAAALAGEAFDRQPGEILLMQYATYLQADGQHAKVTAVLRDWLEDNPGSSEAQLALGMSLALEGDSGASIVQYRELLQQNPNDFVALNNLAWELREKDNKAALEYAQRAVQQQPDNAAALDTLAVVQYISGDYSAAQTSITRALDLAPGEPSLQYHNAMIEAARGETRAAAAILQQLIDRGADFPELPDARALLSSLQ